MIGTNPSEEGATTADRIAGRVPQPPLRRGRRGRRGVGPVVVVAVVVVVLVVAAIGVLFATGVLPTGGGGSSLPRYAVGFNETGLTAGAIWSVTLGGSTHGGSQSSLQFQVPNGTYGWRASAVGYAAQPQSGNVKVAGPGSSQTIVFTAGTTYAVTFNESGLVGGTPWTVTLGGSPQTTTGPSMIFLELNGSYPFSASAPNYAAHPTTGTLVVAGQATDRHVQFVAGPANYDVTFSETGLGSGTTWEVVFNGTLQSSTDTTLNFTGYLNGTYSFAVSAISYNATPSSGSVTIAGTDPTVPIVFTPSGAPGLAVIASQAESIAASTVAGYYGTGWTIFEATAVAFPTPFPVPTSNLNFSDLCPGNWIGKQPANITFPATSASAADGASAAWLVFFIQVKNSSFLATDVLNAVATPLFFGSGSGCSQFVGYTIGGAIDSPPAVSVANENGGSAFLAAHPGTTALFDLVGGYPDSGISPLWGIFYTTCQPSQTSGSGEAFNATVNGTTGELISTSSGPVGCQNGPDGTSAPASGWVASATTIAARAERLGWIPGRG